MGAPPPAAFDLWLSAARGGAPAKVADVSLSLRADEGCLMRKGWDPDKLPRPVLGHYGRRYLLPFKSLPR